MGDLGHATQVIDAAVGLATLLVIVFGWVRFVRPRLAKATAEVTAVRDSILGRDEIRDSITGRVLAPSLDGMGVRQERTEDQVATLVLSQRQLTETVNRLAEQQQRLDNHEARITKLEEAAIERIVTRADSALGWAAVRAVANSGADESVGDASEDLADLDEDIDTAFGLDLD